jgi:hypothetical protein
VKGTTQPSLMRDFESGATRSSDAGKPDYEGYMSPLVIERFGRYMTEHRKQADGKLRDSDNWQKGIPRAAYIKSCFRHFMDWWKYHRGHYIEYGIEETLCAVMFNTMGYLHEHIKARDAAQEKHREAASCKAAPGKDGQSLPGWDSRLVVFGEDGRPVGRVEMDRSAARPGYDAHSAGYLWLTDPVAER